MDDNTAFVLFMLVIVVVPLLPAIIRAIRGQSRPDDD